MSEKTMKGDWLKFHANKCFFFRIRAAILKYISNACYLQMIETDISSVSLSVK